MKKRIIEKNVPENVDLFETIVEYMQKYKCWIHISKGLSKRLKDRYLHYEYACDNPEGMIYIIRSEPKGLKMYVSKEFTWDRVSNVDGYLNETSEMRDAPKIAEDPEYIVFMS